jgi:serpin B
MPKRNGKGSDSSKPLSDWEKQYQEYQKKQAEIQALRDLHSADVLKAAPANFTAPLGSLGTLGVKLLKAHNDSVKGKNTALFPSSIHPVMMMLHAAAKGQTADEITAAYGIKGSKTFQTGYGKLLSAMRGNKDFTLDIFNKIWTARGLSLLADYKKVLKKYETTYDSLDFNQRQAAADALNKWADISTRGLITNIATPDLFTPDTVAVLGNAVYFKGQWIQPFDKGHTRDWTFTPDGGKAIQVPTMFLKKEPVRCFQVAGFTGIDLPMKGASVILLLPDAGKTLDQSIAAMPEDLMEQIDAELKQASPTGLDIYLPKFKIETPAYDLVAPSRAAGVNTLFTPGASNLSGMMNASVFISAMLHKAVIEVDEEGATGAAVTIAVAEATSFRPPTEIRFNRSFLAIVRDRSKAPVAFAKVQNPTAG